MNTKTPRVSIGMPVYNGGRYVGQAIESMLAQTYGDFELIVSDNGSSDGTEDICRTHAAADRRIRYFRETENQGAAWNFNRVVELSRGEFFKWAACDDLCAPTFLERCIEAFEEDPAIVLACPSAAVIDGDGRPVDQSCAGQSTGGTGKRPRLCDPSRADYLGSCQPHRRFLGVLVHSERCYEEFGLMRIVALRKTGLHRPFRGAEKVFLAEMSLVGRFGEIPEVLFFNRWHDGRFSSIATASEQSLWVNPRASRRFTMPRQVRCTWGYFLLTFTAELSPLERLRCLLVWGRFLSRAGKWKQAISEALHGAGMTAKLAEVEPAAKESRRSISRERTVQSVWK